jgi:hypothetical protein
MSETQTELVEEPKSFDEAVSAVEQRDSGKRSKPVRHGPKGHVATSLR